MEQAVRKERRRNGLIILMAILVAILVGLVIVVLSGLKSEPQPPVDTTATTDVPTQPTRPTQTTPTKPAEIAGLTVTEPALTGILWTEKTITFRGTADPREVLTIGGQTVPVSQDGSFAQEVTLQWGSNEIAVVYRGETVIYQIQHYYALQYITPVGDGVYSCGAVLEVSAAIREGAGLTVHFNGEIIPMKEAAVQPQSGLAEGFVLYTGSYALPSRNLDDLNMGAITFVATCDGQTEILASGTVTCLKRTDVLKSDPSVTPQGGSYVDVGSGYIVEILNNSAETFLGSDVSKDKSSPKVNYLPKGTVDYGYVEDIENGTYTIRLRCGRRVYLKLKNYPPVTLPKVVDTYLGTLPDHNEIRVAQLKQNRDHTVLVLDTLWKAPFYFDLLPQRYVNEGIQDYRVDQVTAEYVDITFCYATRFTGNVQIPDDNPLFSRAVLTQNKNDCTLRLYLKKTGGFYGWDAYYNDAGQLCFRFINPKTVHKTDTNPYGVDLTGVNIMLDVGHGGRDPGAVVGGYHEADLNLQLAMKLKAELESMGATVLLNRSDDRSLTSQDRIAYLKEQGVDLCLAIHQNSLDGYPNLSGFELGYATPFSQPAAELIFEETEASGIYSNHRLYWHYYYVARETACPVVLLENGYMTNADDLAGMIDGQIQLKKARAVARGVARYFQWMNE